MGAGGEKAGGGFGIGFALYDIPRSGVFPVKKGFVRHDVFVESGGVAPTAPKRGCSLYGE